MNDINHWVYGFVLICNIFIYYTHGAISHSYILSRTLFGIWDNRNNPFINYYQLNQPINGVNSNAFVFVGNLFINYEHGAVSNC